MEDSEGGPKMGLRIKPLWDPTGSVSVEFDEERRELVVRTGGELLRFVLSEERPDRLGWVECRTAHGAVRRRRVAVGEVVALPGRVGGRAAGARAEPAGGRARA
jgi:hypothetical protein